MRLVRFVSAGYNAERVSAGLGLAPAGRRGIHIGCAANGGQWKEGTNDEGHVFNPGHSSRLGVGVAG